METTKLNTLYNRICGLDKRMGIASILCHTLLLNGDNGNKIERLDNRMGIASILCHTLLLNGDNGNRTK